MSQRVSVKQVAMITGLFVLGGLVLFTLLSGIQLSPVQESSAYLEVDPGGSQSNTPGDSVEFEELSPDQQDLFKEAIERDHVEIPDEADSNVWYESDIVQYQNTTYTIRVMEN